LICISYNHFSNINLTIELTGFATRQKLSLADTALTGRIRAPRGKFRVERFVMRYF